MSEAISGVGAHLRRLSTAASSGAVYEPLAEVKSISGPSMARETIDVTNLDSVGGYREFIAGIRDPGDIALECNFTRDGYELMKTDFESDDLQSYEIALPDDENTTFQFSGLVTDLPLSIKPDDAITCSVTIKISGPVTVTSGS